jgi:hypothetical protein
MRNCFAEKGTRRVGGGAVLAALFALALAWAIPAAPVAAQESGDVYREFFGLVQSVSSKEMVVDNRMGDKLKFVPAEDPQIVDATSSERKKEKWSDLKKNDWVTVSWKMMDKPRKAYIVKVMPPKEEAGEFVE